MGRSELGRWAGNVAGAALVGLGLSGCANLWDDLTSRDRPFSQRVKGFFVKPEPLVTLRDSIDGDERARALRALKEPKANQGSDEEQDLVMKILITSATAEHWPECRLVAVQKLGQFKDPRGAKALQDAFYNAADFPPEVATRIQVQVLTALGETGNPEVVHFLVEKLREPPAERSDYAQQRTDRCIAAAEALARYKDREAVEALTQMLKREKEDVALRNRVHESLVTATGQDLPAEYQAWEDFLHPKDEKALAESRPAGRKFNLVGWLLP